MLNQLKTLRTLTEAEKQAIAELERQYNLFLATMWKISAALPCDKKELVKAESNLKDTLFSAVRSIVLAIKV